MSGLTVCEHAEGRQRLAEVLLSFRFGEKNNAPKLKKFAILMIAIFKTLLAQLITLTVKEKNF
jgi:hypothetical protein